MDDDHFTMKRWFERALNVHSGDLGHAILLSSCLFLTISAYVIGKVARDALFLAQFQAVYLPYADIASGVLVGFVVIGYLRLGKHISVRHLLINSPIVFASNCALFWLLAVRPHPAWLYPIFYIWVGIYGVLAPTQVWTLANFLLTTREAKRIFGIVGGGAICGWIFAGYMARIIAVTFGTESLLLAMAVLLVSCSVLMGIAWKGETVPRDTFTESEMGVAGTGQKDFQDSLRSVFSSSYLRAIAAVICISSFATTLTGWQFKALAQQSIDRKDALAVLFGDFYFYAGLASLAFQLLVTTRLLRRFGIGRVLFLLPLTVLSGSAGLLIWGTFSAALLLKGSDQVLRYSIDRSAIELLYLPLPHDVRLQAKWFIDTVVWRFGDGLAGVVILVFAAKLRVLPQQISWIAMLLTCGWLVAVYIAGKHYVSALKASINQQRLDTDRTSAFALDRSAIDLLASKTQAADPTEILYALSLFEVERQRAAHPAIRGLLTHPSAQVRQKAVSILSFAGDRSVRPTIARLLKDADPAVRTEAMLYLVYHHHVDPLTLLAELGDFADFSIRSAVAAFLARPGEAQNIEAARQILEEMSRETGEQGQRIRIEAARLLGELPDQFEPLLSALLHDSDALVVREAIRSAGKLEKLSLAAALLELLLNRELASEAGHSLAKLGDRGVAFLADRLQDSSLATETRKAIPPVLALIGTPRAADALMDCLIEPDASIRFQVISALNKVHQAHPAIELDTQLLESMLAAEILGHYRSYQILAALNVSGSDDQQISRALEESLEQERERIFRLLGLLHPQLDLQAVYLGLQSSSAVIYDNSLEFLDNVLKSQLRGILLPLLDGKVGAKERAKLAERLLRAKIENREQAVVALISSDDPWLKSCGAYVIGAFGMKSLRAELNRCLMHPDPLLRETARAAKNRLEALTGNL